MQNKMGIPLEGFDQEVRYAAAQGAVLLRNDAQVLPVQKGEGVSVFGRTQMNYYRSGTGSGGSVNVAYEVSFQNALRSQEGLVINESLAKVYEAWAEEHPFDNGGGGWAAEPWYQEEMELDEQLVKKAAQTSGKAIVLIGRTAGEDKDNTPEPGSYYLTEKEKNMLALVCDAFEQVIIVLNISNIMDLSWLEDQGLQKNKLAVLLAWQGGVTGACGIADVISGKVTPGGKLTATIAKHLQDYPSTANYGRRDRNIYQEDIYVGYRYFSTFAPEKVQYCFGYGISYTTFTIEAQASVLLDKKTLCIDTEVENTGTRYSGKEVVQVYCEAPQGKLGQPARKLIGFQKTRDLQPGEKQQLKITIPFSVMASYDDAGVSGYPFSYVLEKGEYRIYVGNSLVNSSRVMIEREEGFRLSETILMEQLQQALAPAPASAFERYKAGARCEDGRYQLSYEKAPLSKVRLAERIQESLPDDIPITVPDSSMPRIQLRDVHEKKATMDEFIAQLSVKELAQIVRGEGMCSPKVTPGTAAAFGGVTDKLLAYGIPLACAADGPSGIRMEGGLMATQLPIGTLLASTWDMELLERLYVMEGKELCRNEVDVLLGPGMNIQRNPLNGRNFEYFSEDPLVTGKCAAAIVRGIHAGGANAVIKHFAANNQESFRHEADSVVSERALREIYLKGFEIAVREGNAKAVMTAYNPLNGYWTASNYDLTTTILRKEWKFEGIVMTDWWANMNDVEEGGAPNTYDTRSMVRAQNDLYMVVDNYGAEVNPRNDNTEEALMQGRLAIGELQRCAKNICQFLLDTLAFTSHRNLLKPVRLFQALPLEAISGQETYLTEETVNVGEKQEFRIAVPKAGLYGLYVCASADGTDMAQSACSFYLNDEFAIPMQLNGTLGRQVKQKLGRIKLEEGGYLLRLEYPGKGINLEWFRVEKEEG